VTDTNVVADFVELGMLGMATHVSASGTWRVSLLAGPQVGLRLKARRRFREADQDVTQELRGADLKAALGLRLRRSLGRGSVFIEARAALGLTDLDATHQQSIRARVLGLHLGYTR
jgi:hypothetical protein